MFSKTRKIKRQNIKINIMRASSIIDYTLIETVRSYSLMFSIYLYEDLSKRSVTPYVTVIVTLRKLAHAIYREFFQLKKIENFIEKFLKFLIF